MHPILRGIPARLANAAFAVRRVAFYLVVAALLMNLMMGPVVPDVAP
ncbi:hypothetical protein [Pseudothauera nasutitermitis]|nr:hypothetical protein [Pseudothauera nasutitermitis]